MPRRFITRQDIDALADSGATVLEVDDHTTVTDTAREHARDRGVRVVRAPLGAPAAVTAGAEPTATSPPTGAEVRAAVVARLGHEPEGLDDAVSRVLDRTGG